MPPAQPTQFIAPVWDWYLPSTHGTQAGWPDAIWNWPAAQLGQLLAAAELGSALPGAHAAQSGAAALEAKKPAAQATHCAEAAEPRPAVVLPASHAAQVTVPESEAYLGRNGLFNF